MLDLLSKRSKFVPRYWVEINVDSRGAYYTNSEIKSKTSILKSDLWDCSVTYILVNGITIFAGSGYDSAARQSDQ